MESKEGIKSPLKQGMIKAVRVLLTVYVLLCLGVYFFQAKLVFVPTKGEPAYTPQNLGLEYKNLFLESGSESIHAWFVSAKESRGTVLFCHGNAGNLGHRLSTIKIWHELGMNILLFDYRGFGESSGDPSEEGCYEDVKACFDWLQNNAFLEKPLIIHGRSLGGGIASWAAENLENDGLILESTFTSIPDMGAHIYPFLPIRLLSSIDFPTEERIKKYTKPLLIVHGKNDEIIPYKMGQALAQKSGADFIELQGNHNDGFSTSQSYIPALNAFVERVISLKPSE